MDEHLKQQQVAQDNNKVYESLPLNELLYNNLLRREGGIDYATFEARKFFKFAWLPFIPQRCTHVGVCYLADERNHVEELDFTQVARKGATIFQVGATRQHEVLLDTGKLYKPFWVPHFSLYKVPCGFKLTLNALPEECCGETFVLVCFEITG